MSAVDYDISFTHEKSVWEYFEELRGKRYSKKEIQRIIIYLRFNMFALSPVTIAVCLALGGPLRGIVLGVADGDFSPGRLLFNVVWCTMVFFIHRAIFKKAWKNACNLFRAFEMIGLFDKMK